MAIPHITVEHLVRNRIAGRFAPTIPEAECEACGRTFRPKRSDRLKFCSQACGWIGQRHRPKTESWPACPVAFGECGHCGKAFASRSKARRFCSDECSSASRRPIPRVPINCAECDASFKPYGTSSKYCSKKCLRKAFRRSSRKKYGHKVRSRARHHGVHYEPVDISAVFNRDGWRCQVCGVKTPKRLRGSYNNRAPELDHRTPMVMGGPHRMDNLQCCCRKCNRDKGGNIILWQLSLFII